jgi:hypothetical protein
MLRWSDKTDGVDFSLYILKWRVPNPWLSSGLVVVDDMVARVQEKNLSYINDHLEEPINVVVEKFKDHGDRVRFKPVRKDKRNWETGEPYIPASILPYRSIKYVRIEVNWLRNAGTWGDDDA